MFRVSESSLISWAVRFITYLGGRGAGRFRIVVRVNVKVVTLKPLL